MTEMRDFSKKRSHEPIYFKIDDDTFEAVPIVPPALILEITDTEDLAELAEVDPEKATPQQLAQLQAGMRRMHLKVIEFLETVLVRESSERFAQRLRSTTEPIDLDQVQQIAQWLVGQYSNRPTEPSKSSVNGLDGNGTASTDIVPIGT